jgi:hypothetical protein
MKPLDAVLSQRDVVHILTYSSLIHFNIIIHLGLNIKLIL